MATPVPFDGLEDLQEHLRKTDITAEADQLEMHLEAATEAAEGWCPTGRSPVGPIVTREFTDRVWAENGMLILGHTPVQSVTSATRVPGGFEYVTADLDVDKAAGIVTGISGYIGSGKYDVVYQAGRGGVPGVPMSLKLAVLIIAGHIWEIQRGPRSRNFVGHASSDESSMHRVSSGYLIPNRAAHLMEPYAGVFVG